MPETLTKQEKMERWIARHIKRPPLTMYDIGVGPKTEAQTLKRLYPKMEVYGCEPLLHLYQGMEESFCGQVMPVALGRETGHTTIHYNPESLLDASAVRHTLGQTASKRVPVWTLDQFDEWFGKPKRVLLWMDIEGMELAALQGGHGLLASHRVRWINLEERRADLEGWPKSEDIRQLLASYGYIRVQEYNKHPLHQDVVYRYKGEDSV